MSKPEKGHEARSLIGKALIAQGSLTEEKWEELLAEHGFLSKEELISEGIVTAEEINLAIANYFGTEVLKIIQPEEILEDLLQNVPYSFVKKHCCLPMRRCESGSIVVAINDPLDFDLLDHLRFLLDAEINPAYATKEIINAAIDICYERAGGDTSRMIASLSDRAEKHDDEEEGVYDLLEDKEQAPVIKLLYLILSEAISQGASDIHFEPFEEALRVRYRIDGVLQKRHTPAAEYQAALITRVKVMAKLDIAERRLPQDGRIKLRMGGKEIDFRVSSLPVANGERIVLRILNKGDVMLGLDALGMEPKALNKFRNLIALPEGIILVTGPTGSGKTTTLYSALGEIYSDKLNIMTIEDPVEYKMKGVAQIAVKPKIKLTFAAGLRSILRQDPDIVMIGEIRDTETAAIAVQSSLTGHLVLSTLHTNDAPSAITRLVDMDVEPYLLASSLAGVVAQRLVRRLCTNCCETYSPTDAELAQIGLTKKEIKKASIFRAKGCDKCFDTGYKGRHGVYELMVVTEKIKKQITESPDATALRHMALEEGMMPLRAHGAELVKLGITTIEEVLRIAKGVTLDEL